MDRDLHLRKAEKLFKKLLRFVEKDRNIHPASVMHAASHLLAVAAAGHIKESSGGIKRGKELAHGMVDEHFDALEASAEYYKTLN